MPGENAAPANGPQEQQGSWLGKILRMITMYMVVSYFFKGKGTGNLNTTDTTGKVLPPLKNAWDFGQNFDLRIYLTEDYEFSDFGNKDKLIWEEKRIPYDWSDASIRHKEMNITPSVELQNNGSIYAHIYFTKSNYLPAQSSPDNFANIHVVKQLNKHALHKRKILKNLMGGSIDSQQVPEDAPTTEILNFWRPNLTLHLVDDQTVFSRNGVPPQIQDSMQIDEERSVYYPIVFVDEFWLLKENLIIINNTVTSLPLSLDYNPISMMRWQIYSQMAQSFDMQQSMGTAGEGDQDEFKRMLTDTNPYLLGVTMVVSLLHSIFDFLAFKNDIQFWRNKKNLEGMSVRTMILNFFCQIIIFLYLMDNDTSWIILISSGVGLGIEGWKIKKAVNIEIDWTKKFPITFTDRASYVSKTKEYDQMAMKYLSWVLFPLVIGYAIYSLYYENHKSWYSWVIGSLSGCVYTFGFIMMCPQLFINYKLKSVAHLPFRTFTYKALNTFIDDLFAFIIKMPTLHRLSCFRDDLIFLVYLYQRWIYRIDYSRVNEFGQGGDEPTPDATATRPVDTTAERPAIDQADQTESKTDADKKAD